MTSSHTYLKYLYVFALVLCSCFSAYGQINFANPSYEGNPGQTDAVAPGWTKCTSTPDVQPGAWCVDIPPQDGSSYGGFTNGESIAQLLECSFKANKTYQFTLYLAYDDQYGSTIVAGACAQPRNNPGNFQLWGANSSCGKEELLFESGAIDASHFLNWVQHKIEFTPTKDFSWVRFESEGNNSHILIDNISAVIREVDGADITPVSCTGGNDGAITVYPPSDGAVYSYIWSNNEVTPTIKDLSAGLYDVTLLDPLDVCGDITATFEVPEPEPLEVEVVCNNVSQARATDGSSTATSSGGVMPYSYSWNNGESGPTINSLAPGIYEVTVTDKNGCIATASCEVLDPFCNLEIVDSIVTHPLCFGSADGTIELVVESPSPPVNYTWSVAGETEEVLTGIGAGVYNVTISDADCDAFAIFNVIQPTVITPQIVEVIDVTCSGEEDGEAEVTASGGTPGYSFEWSSGDDDTKVDGLSGGIYDVTVQDQNACEIVFQVDVFEPDPMTVDPIITEAFCAEPVGVVDPQVKGGNPDYIFEWSDNSGNSILDGVEPGEYELLVYDLNDCELEAEFVVPGTPLVIDFKVKKQPDCGAENGRAKVEVDEGTPPYTFEWSYPVGTPTDVEDNDMLSVGEHELVVTDAKGCEIEQEFELVVPDGMTLAVTTKNVDCFGEATGSILLSPSNNTGVVTYEWSNAGTITHNTDESELNEGLLAGLYSVTATDEKGCVFVLENMEVLEPNMPLGTDIDTTQISCFGANDGALKANGIGGTAPYNYSWTNGAGDVVNSTNGEIKPLSPESYQVSLTDSKGCTYLHNSVVVAEPAELIVAPAMTPTNCLGEQSGAVDLIVQQGGVGNFTYELNAVNQANSLFDSLNGGSYTWTVTDDNNCIDQGTIVVTEPAALVLDTVAGAQINPGCAEEASGKGEVYLVEPGNSGVYAYAWSVNDTVLFLGAAQSQLLGEVVYDVKVTDSKGCQDSLSIRLIDPLGMVPTLNPTAARCFGSADGNLHLTFENGASPFQFNWSNGETHNSPDRRDSLVALTAGSYTVQISDANGCAIARNFEILEPQLLMVDGAIDIVHIDCYSAATGAFTVPTSGGVAPYSYSINAPNDFQPSNSFTDLLAGEYQLVIQDANGCTTPPQLVEIIEPAPIVWSTPNIDHLTCYQVNEGAIAVEILSGGTAPFQFTWNNGFANSGIATEQSNLQSGVYNISIIDAQGCMYEYPDALEIIEPDQVVINILEIAPVACNNQASGSLVVDLGNAALPVGSINWSNNVNTIENNNIIGGDYGVTIIDNDGCMASANYTLLNPAPIIAEMTGYKEPTCFGYSDGVLFADIVAGGPQNPPYTYDWTNGTTNRANTNLVTGNYGVTITDALGCSVSISEFLDEPEEIKLFAGGVLDIKEGQRIDLAPAITPAQNYTYTWMPNTSMTDSDIANPRISPVDTIVYTLVVTSDSGCVATDTLVVNVEPYIEVVLPNAFLPTSNSNDRLFYQENSSEYDFVYYRIFDRWGAAIYEGTSPWDGKNAEGLYVLQGTYAYILEVEVTANNNERRTLRGNVTVLY